MHTCMYVCVFVCVFVCVCACVCVCVTIRDVQALIPTCSTPPPKPDISSVLIIYSVYIRISIVNPFEIIV